MDLGALQRATPTAGPDTFTAVVVRADESGLWVVEEGGDPRHPVGPCRGGWTANGTRVPVGAVVALTYTETDPWVVGFDNPALAVADGTLAPFDNPSFELATADGYPVGWSDFWTQSRRVNNPATLPVPAGKYRLLVEEGNAAHGAKCHRFDANATTGVLESHEWSVPPGSSVEVSIYARGAGVDPRLYVAVWTNVSGTYAGPFGSGAGIFYPIDVTPGADWLRYRAVVTLPPTHSRVNLLINGGSETGIATVWIDNVDADLVQIDPTVGTQDIVRRLVSTLGGGGTRTVTAGGNVSWSQPFTVGGTNRDEDVPDGRFEITQPPNGTVVPVHGSSVRTSHTVAGGVITLNADDGLWYELPIGSAAASQPGRFHILAATAVNDYDVPPHWILVVRRTAWSATAHAVEYRWGDGNGQDPWRTPSLAAGWAEGTIAPRYTKTANGLVVMRGRVKTGTGTAFVLPDGYRPGVQHEAPVRDGVGAVGFVTVTTGGAVTVSGNTTDHSIATTFPVLGG